MRSIDVKIEKKQIAPKVQMYQNNPKYYRKN